MTEHHTSDVGFSNLTIAPQLLEIISGMGYKTPTPIQKQSIPLLIEVKDLLGIAQTGTGKTLAFALPVIQRLAREKGRCLVMVPTRELALQVSESFVKLGVKIGLKTTVLIGGADINRQMKALKTFPHVIVGTPGRIIDHLERKTLKLGDVKILVLDEADLMLDMGFAPQIARIMESVPKDRQTMLFSATMPAAIHKLTLAYMINPTRVEVARAGTVADRIVQEVRYVGAGQKSMALDDILKTEKGTAIVFVRTKHAAKKITFDLRKHEVNAAEIHSNRSLAQRRAALDGFKFGKYRVLVATDIAARGIDVSGISLIVNYDLPENPEDYVHRIGRTGRAGLAGHAISLATSSQRQLVKRIEKQMGTSIGVSANHMPSKDREYETPRFEKSSPSHSPHSRYPKKEYRPAQRSGNSSAPRSRFSGGGSGAKGPKGFYASDRRYSKKSAPVKKDAQVRFMTKKPRHGDL